MKESTLFKIALFFSLIGIFLIVVIAENLEIKLYKISSITNSNLDEKVKIIGVVDSIKETPGLIILDVKDETGKIKVVLFKEEKIEINKYDNVEVIGKIVKYKNILEIEAETIIKI